MREAVRTGAGGGLAARRAAGALRGALVAEKVRFRSGLGREVLAGFRHDPAFGPVVVMGVGGLDTEYLLGSLLPERAKASVGAARGSDTGDGARGLLRGHRRARSPGRRACAAPAARASTERRPGAACWSRWPALAER